MRHLMVIFLILVFLGSAYALDLGNQPARVKDNSHVGQNPGQPDSRQGGEDMESAVLIPSLPFSDTGNTSDNINDYDAVCPYSGSTAPDVVYLYQPQQDIVIQVDLCGSGYDTKTYILEESGGELVACNDDFYTGDPCGLYVSLIEDAYLLAGHDYYIVIDGYGTDAGDYVLNIDEFTPPPPCIITCEGYDEGEPELGDGYIDMYNTGCNDEMGLFPFQDLYPDWDGELTFCGKSGWYSSDGYNELRDTDWFTAVIGAYGVVEWTLDAEQPSLGFLLNPQDCASVGVDLSMEVGPCVPATMNIHGNPGDIIWLWVGPAEYTPPAGFVGHEFNYIANYVGLEESCISTNSSTLDRVKSLYR